MTTASSKQDNPHPNPDAPPDAAFIVDHRDAPPGATLSCTVVHAMADAETMPIRRAEVMLDQHANRDAVDAIFRPRESGHDRLGATLQFTTRSPPLEVTVFACGKVRVDPMCGGGA